MYCARCNVKRSRVPGTKSWYKRWKKVIGIRYKTDQGKKKATVSWYCPTCAKTLG